MSPVFDLRLNLALKFLSATNIYYGNVYILGVETMPRGSTKESEDLRRKKISDTLKGHKVSEETRRKIIDAQKGIPKSEESCKKMSESHKGKIHSEETRRKISDSNKGKKLSEEHRQILIKVNTGKKASDETKAKLSQYNKDHPEVGDRLRKLAEDRVGKPLSEETRKKIGEASKGHTLSADARNRISIAQTGENNSMFGKVGDQHPNWKGGISYFPYCFKFNEKRKKAVREYFNNLCICTGEPQYNQALSVHHIDHDKEQGCNGKPFNLVPMCIEHHTKEQYNQEEYKSYINKTLREGFKWGIWNEQEYIEKVMY